MEHPTGTSKYREAHGNESFWRYRPLGALKPRPQVEARAERLLLLGWFQDLLSKSGGVSRIRHQNIQGNKDGEAVTADDRQKVMPIITHNRQEQQHVNHTVNCQGLPEDQIP